MISRPNPGVEGTNSDPQASALAGQEFTDQLSELVEVKPRATVSYLRLLEMYSAFRLGLG